MPAALTSSSTSVRRSWDHEQGAVGGYQQVAGTRPRECSEGPGGPEKTIMV